MATIDELIAAQSMFKLDAGLEPDEQVLRLFYTSPPLRNWIENVLPTIESFHGSEIDPTGDLDALISIYASGLPLVFGRQFKAFHRKAFDHVGDGVWYLKTPDLRIFGWFHVRDCFIGVVANTFEMVKRHNLYQGHRGEVIHFRNQLQLNEPKFIPGENPDDVLSNYDIAD
jgi:hypothetical protein